MKKLLLGLLAGIVLVSCGNKASEAGKTEGAKAEKIVIGATPVPHAEFLELVKEDLAKEGVELVVEVFNDYIQPNKLVASGELDANFFQHEPYLEEFAAANNLDLVSIGGVHVEPMAVYSKKIKGVEELKDGDTVLIPNDPTNGGRALILLDKAGVIKLKDNKNLVATVEDIVENSKNLNIKALAAEQIAPRLNEVAAAIINSNYAIDAKLTVNDRILVEDKDSPYVNIVAVAKGKEGEERFAKLMKALQSEKLRKYIDEKYNGSILAGF